MRRRCRDSKNPAYKNYGGRGIDICDEWHDSFDAFELWSMQHGYDDSLTIDRIDNNKGYSPDNCRWATYSQQARNRRRNHVIEHNGESHALCEWEEITGIKAKVIYNRIYKYGWSVDDALMTPTIKK